MANTYKNIVITPNRTSNALAVPVIQFSGGDQTSNTDIYLRVHTTSNGTLSFDGSVGQLFSISNDLANTLFTVNDVSGIPAMEISANGLITMSEFYGNVAIGRGNVTSGYKLDVNGTINASAVLVNGSPIAGGGGVDAVTLNGANAISIAAFTKANAANVLAFNALPNTSGVSFAGNLYFPSGFVGIGNTNPIANLHVNGNFFVSLNNAPSLAVIGEIAEFSGDANNYAQIHVRNANTGTRSSGDIVVTADVGTDTSDYIDLGINNSNFNDPSWTVSGAKDGYLYTSNGNLAIGTANAGRSIFLFAGGTTSQYERVQIDGALGSNTVNITGNTVVSETLYAKAFVGTGTGFSNMNVISSIGYAVWNVPPGVRRWKVTLVGGGGAGGGAHATAGYNGNGGGSGGVCIGFYNYVPGVTTMALNVGRGGYITSALNANGFSGNSTNVNYNSVWMFANAGTGGANSWFGANVNAVGIGGAASGGSLNLIGDDGGGGGLTAATNPLYPEGGHTPLGYGQGGIIGPERTGANGTNASGFGAGGGAGRNTSGTTLRRGGFGGNGVVIIEW